MTVRLMDHVGLNAEPDDIISNIGVCTRATWGGPPSPLLARSLGQAACRSRLVRLAVVR